MTFTSRSILSLASSLVLPLLLGAAAYAQALPGPGGMSGGAAPAGETPAMPGAPIPAPGMMGGTAGGLAPGMSQNMPGAMPQTTSPGSALGSATPATPAPPTAPMNGTTMNGGSATNGPVMTAFHGTVYQTHKTGNSTEGFVTIKNQGAGPDTLTTVTCPIADTTLLMDAGGTTVNNLDVAAGTSVVLASKGLHLELQNIHFQVLLGSVIPCMLNFRTFGEIQVLLYAAKPANY